MASNSLCALCGLIVAAVVNIYGVSAQKSKWNLFEHQTLVAMCVFLRLPNQIFFFFFFLRNRGNVLRERLLRCFCEHAVCWVCSASNGGR